MRGFIHKMSAHTEQRIELLTPREREVFEDLIVGRSNRAIADKLSISPRTVEVHRYRVMKKMQAQNLALLIRMAFGIGLQVEPSKNMDTQVAQRVERLTPRQKDIFNLVVAGHSNSLIAANLEISPRTVEVHRYRVMKKMQAQSLPHLVRMALGIEAQEKAYARPTSTAHGFSRPPRARKSSA
jgi:two-component system response regulator FixJ